MKYRYSPLGDEWMPQLDVGLHMPRGYFLDTMLLDTGSHYTLIHYSLLQEYGVEIGDEPINLAGVGGEPFTGFPAKVEFSIERHRFIANVIAVDDRHLPIALLGHRGFFEHFDGATLGL
jgi:hypothetical protein